MRFATWNLSHGVKRGSARRAAAWKHLASLGADVVMVQEAGMPMQSVGGAVVATNPRISNWVTAVVSYGPTLSELEQPIRPRRNLEFWIPDAARPGTLAVGVVDVPGARPVLAISLYGKLRYAYQSVLRAASDLVPIFQTSLGKRVVLGGDLNMHTAARDEDERARSGAILALIETLGLRNLVKTHGP